MARATSPLSAIDARYLEAGESLALALDDSGTLTLSGDAPADGPGVLMHVAMTDRLQCARGCGDSPRAIDGREQFQLPGHERWTVILAEQSGKGRVLVHDAQAPALTGFAGLAWFPVDGSRVVSARFVRANPRPAVELATNRGLVKTLHVAGRLQFAFADGSRHELIAYAYVAEPEQGEPLLIPFGDRTSGEESYGSGRYLEPTNDLDADTMELDFNRATNPYCAYSPHYNCPMPTRDNQLPVAIRAGEKVYDKH